MEEEVHAWVAGGQVGGREIFGKAHWWVLDDGIGGQVRCSDVSGRHQWGKTVVVIDEVQVSSLGD